MEIINEEKFSEGTESRTFMRFPYLQIQTNGISPFPSPLHYPTLLLDTLRHAWRLLIMKM